MKIFMAFLALLNALSAMSAAPAESGEIQVYARDAIVLEDGCGGLLFEDSTGNLWDFYTEDLMIGQRVVLVMSDNATPTIYDDTVLRVLPLAVTDYHDFDNLHFHGEAKG